VGGVVDVTTAVLRDGGRHASIADPDALGAGGEWLWVRPDGPALGEIAELAAEGTLTVPVSEVFPLEELAAAFALSREGHTRGKIVVRVSD